MLLDLHKPTEFRISATTGLRFSRWHDRYFDPCAKLIYLAYANHVDGDINDQYRSKAGALRFLKNIIYFRGAANLFSAPLSSCTIRGATIWLVRCSQAKFLPALDTLRRSASCPAIRATDSGARSCLRQPTPSRTEIQELTLTVTAENRTAVRLYEQLGFKTLKTFTAGVWPR